MVENQVFFRYTLIHTCWGKLGRKIITDSVTQTTYMYFSDHDFRQRESLLPKSPVQKIVKFKPSLASDYTSSSFTMIQKDPFRKYVHSNNFKTIQTIDILNIYTNNFKNVFSY